MIFKYSILLSVALLGLTACSEQQKSNNQSSVSEDAAASTPADQNSARLAVLAAAEPFEALTEQAPDVDSSKLSGLIANANDAALKISAHLTEAQRHALDVRLGEISTANKKSDRIAIAIAAVEGYRVLVESAPDTGAIPRAVSLLDYAGFRYQADLSAQPVRWDDAMDALKFADSQWTGLSGQVRDTQLEARFSDALKSMRDAAQARDKPAATTAATRELDLVDELEGHFGKRP